MGIVESVTQTQLDWCGVIDACMVWFVRACVCARAFKEGIDFCTLDLNDVETDAGLTNPRLITTTTTTRGCKDCWSLVPAVCVHRFASFRLINRPVGSFRWALTLHADNICTSCTSLFGETAVETVVLVTPVTWW